MTISDAGIQMIEGFEGFSASAYQDQRGIWTIGYGHTRDVHEGDTCTPAQAQEWLASDLQTAQNIVNELVTASLNQNQFDALTSFVYNVGGGNFGKSTLLRELNAGNFAGASDEFPKWNKTGGKVSNGLAARRAAEQKLFDTPMESA